MDKPEILICSKQCSSIY